MVFFTKSLLEWLYDNLRAGATEEESSWSTMFVMTEEESSLTSFGGDGNGDVVTYLGKMGSVGIE